MKKILLAGLLFLAVPASAQQINTSPPIGLTAATGAITCTAAGVCTLAAASSIATTLGVGIAVPIGYMNVNGANVATDNAAAAGGLFISTNNSQAVNLGGHLSLGGNSTGAAVAVAFANLAGRKENNTSGDFSGYLVFGTTTAGGNIAERLRISSLGAITMPSLASTSAAQTGTVCWATGTGNLTVDTTTTCLLSSSQFKHNIKPLENSLSTILALRPVSYFYNADQFIPDEQVGLIAEDVDPIDTRLVSKDENGNPRAVRYQQLTAEIISAIQAQQMEIEKLKSRNWCLAGYCF